MWRLLGRFGVAALLLMMGIFACNLPVGKGTPNSADTMVAATMAIVQANIFESQTASVDATALPTLTPTPSPTLTPMTIATPQNPVVLHLALCWSGPGKIYTTVSSVKAGTRVVLIGVGSISGWYIIKNPIYHDLCWIEKKNIQVEPGFDISSLRIYNPPPTPGPTPTP